MLGGGSRGATVWRNAVWLWTGYLQLYFGWRNALCLGVLSAWCGVNQLALSQEIADVSEVRRRRRKLMNNPNPIVSSSRSPNIPFLPSIPTFGMPGIAQMVLVTRYLCLKEHSKSDAALFYTLPRTYWSSGYLIPFMVEHFR